MRAQYRLRTGWFHLYSVVDVKYGMHAMSANEPDVLRAETAVYHETPMEIGPWGLAGEPMLPARHVVWAALALIVVTLGVLIFA